jgi:hypothetical protein
VILRRQGVADVVEEGADHRFLIGPVAEGAGRRLERVLIAVDLVAHLVPGEALQRSNGLLGHPLDQRHVFLGQELVFLEGAVFHPGECDRFFHDPIPDNCHQQPEFIGASTLNPAVNILRR